MKDKNTMKKKSSTAAMPRKENSGQPRQAAPTKSKTMIPEIAISRGVGFPKPNRARVAACEAAVAEFPDLLDPSEALLDVAARHHQRRRHFRSFGPYLLLEVGEEGAMVNLKLNGLLKPFLRKVARWDGGYYLNDATPAGRRMFDYRFTWIEASGYRSEIPPTDFERFAPLVMLCPTVQAKPIVEALFRANPSDPLQALDEFLEVLIEAVEFGECPPFGNTLEFLLGVIQEYCQPGSMGEGIVHSTEAERSVP